MKVLQMQGFSYIAKEKFIYQFNQRIIMSSDNNTQIRLAEVKDIPEVRELLRVTWHDTYGKYIPAEDLDTYLDTVYSEEKLEEILDAEREDCFIAESAGKIAGWTRLRRDDDNDIFYLISLYVLPEFQKLGIGKLLLENAVSFGLEYRFEKITLGVMEANSESVEWYKRQGFKIVRDEPFTWVNTTVNHLIMEKVIFIQ